MPRRTPGWFLSFTVLTAGVLLGYYVLHANGWSGQLDILVIWDHLPVLWRLVFIACMAAIAYGTGGILNRLLLVLRPR
jgi:hypothetical protein